MQPIHNKRKLFFVFLLATTSLFLHCEAFSQPKLMPPIQSRVPSLTNLRKGDEDIHLPVESDGKFAPKVGIGGFLGIAAALPILSVTVLPLTIAYQVGKSLLKPFLPKPKLPQIDSGYTVEEVDIIPRAQRKYDIIVLGASVDDVDRCSSALSSPSDNLILFLGGAETRTSSSWDPSGSSSAPSTWAAAWIIA